MVLPVVSVYILGDVGVGVTVNLVVDCVTLVVVVVGVLGVVTVTFGVEVE